MRGQLVRHLPSLVLGILLTYLICTTFDSNDWNLLNGQLPSFLVQSKTTNLYKWDRFKSNKVLKVCSPAWKERIQNIYNKKPEPRPPKSSNSCKDCRKTIDEILKNYSKPWVKNESRHEAIRTQLSLKCNGFENAIMTQKNTPLGATVVYDSQKTKSVTVNSEHFNRFAKTYPALNKRRHTCAVIGNGGILANSSCGKMIDSAQFVIRCNLAPLLNGYEKHVGVKTDIVTANPSIISHWHDSLLRSRRVFVERLCQYGNSKLFLPAFSYVGHTELCMRAFYTIEDFELPIQPVFFNPNYIDSLNVFWKSFKLKEQRITTGLIMTSLALELCDNVHLYGFWPYSVHPHSFQDLTAHYYDDLKPTNKHLIPEEFKLLLQLHSQGVLKLHLGECKPNK
ncbi:alpha-N-acetylneuraminide alpha-2,8-sialyltransferase-like [Cyprinodon tularosa]|uniref:alpha-N-acetylneuraminide alpha-2,8-sialyltransferase-like n=1 Tax=Cyprinodon tularosa TaxID=77115 RepID=UPI0018E254D8|nr:alpha-N-acetylneuraminide alpha-2,8-sialyltransferase-like [Cyprinodon tularosa]